MVRLMSPMKTRSVLLCSPIFMINFIVSFFGGRGWGTPDHPNDAVGRTPLLNHPVRFFSFQATHKFYAELRSKRTKPQAHLLFLYANPPPSTDSDTHPLTRPVSQIGPCCPILNFPSPHSYSGSGRPMYDHRAVATIRFVSL